MYQKRGQITLFIIIGVIVIAVFLAVIFSVADVAKKQIKSESERIGRAALPREFIRIYIDDCLNDAFTRGLVLLGRQGGRIWQEQGGRVAFEENINGITLNPEETYGRYSTGRVAYGIKAEDYFQHPNAYPCDSEEHAPEFCQYEFPDTETGFGSLSLRPGSIESELSRFVRQEAVQCILNYNEANFTYSNPPEIIPGELQVGITIREGGISVNVEYPLEIRAEGGPSFALEPFHNFYSSKFKQLLDAAITFPLQWDQKFVDFEYREETLTDTEGFTFASPTQLVDDCTPDASDDYFLCPRALHADKYNRLGIEMEPIEADNGDDVFIFRAPPNEIVRAEEYEFRIARQNRPPALDYIGRNECVSEGIPEERQYDYLVIKDDEELGGIELKVTARDPDEEAGFTNLVPLVPIEEGTAEDVSASLSFIEGVIAPHVFQDSGELFSVDVPSDNLALNALQNGIYTVKALATDQHGAEDWQLVRFLVDRPLNVVLQIISPYFIRYEDHPLSLREYFGESQLWLSKEDPFALAVNLPEAAALDGTATVTLKFTPSVQSTPWQGNIQAGYNANAQNHFCFLFPGGIECPSTVDIENAPASFLPLYSNQIESLNPDTFLGPFTEHGELEVAFSFPYCGADQDAPSRNIDIVSKECVPHFNPEYQFPYIIGDPFDFFQWKFDPATNQPLPGTIGTGANAINTLQGDPERTLNPFLATHACCSIDFTPRAAGATCFESPWPGCYGLFTLPEETVPLTSRSNAGYVWEELRATCDGDRGNVCGNLQSSLSKNPRTGNEMLRCGRNGQAFCGAGRTPIATQCQGLPAYSLVGDTGWCQGTFGCADFRGGRMNPVVYDLWVNTAPSFRNEELAERATRETRRLREANLLSLLSSDRPDFPFHSGCRSSDDNKWCDGDFDGRFDGKCDVNQETGAFECLDLICTPNQRRCNSDTEEEDWYICNDLGTGFRESGECASEEYCSGGGECRPKLCTPGRAMCYSTYLDEIRTRDPARAESIINEYQAGLADQIIGDNIAVVCEEQGNGANFAILEEERDNGREVLRACESPCERGITVVNVGILTGQDADDEWRCGGCGSGDTANPRLNREAKPCKTIGGGTELKVCKRDLDTGLPSCLPR